jgi:hypothetical protein
MTFQARYPGRCAACDERIHEGDDVDYDDDQLVHATCPTPPPDLFSVGSTETVCPQCFTVHRGDCL